jgi:hypothetical protein
MSSIFNIFLIFKINSSQILLHSEHLILHIFVSFFFIFKLFLKICDLSLIESKFFILFFTKIFNDRDLMFL